MVMSPSINSGEPPVALKKAARAGRITLAQAQQAIAAGAGSAGTTDEFRLAASSACWENPPSAPAGGRDRTYPAAAAARRGPGPAARGHRRPRSSPGQERLQPLDHRPARQRPTE